MDAGFTAHHAAQIRRLGHVFYGAGLRMQAAMANHVSSATMDPSMRESHPDQILILEHNPVFTLGRNASRSDIHVPDDFLAEQGVEVFQTDRGGQVTYHGPGQIVVYPICALKGPRQDLGRFVRGLQEVMIRTAADFGVRAQCLAGFPGVWVETPRGPEKLGALGVHLRRWVSTHGLAFNVDPDLNHFRWITPCGIADKGVCSLRSLLGEDTPTWDEAAARLEVHLADVLAFDVKPVPAPSRSVSALTWRRSERGIEVLMLLRQPTQGLWWSSVTGMQEPGESDEETALREVFEETGLSGSLGSLGFSHSFWVDPALIGLPEGEPRFNTEVGFHLEVSPLAEVCLNRDEHSDFRWCSLPEAQGLMHWEGGRESLRRLERMLR
jgi:lipoyl(octanoyl) transferase